jgi:methylenetetrahydrofolate reductase (NADPH)
MADQQLDDGQRTAIRGLLEHPIFELIPLKNVLDQAAFLPDGATVSITASPTRTLEDTLGVAAALRFRGFDVIPHLSARMTRDRSHLESLLARIDELDIRSIFVIGGDTADPGKYFDAAALLRAIADTDAVFDEIGIGAYPEGHHIVDSDTALWALHDKQPYATSMTTQMCFDADTIAAWLMAMRTEGIALPAIVGIPGVADRMKLMRISTRIGVGRSMKFLSRHRGLLRAFAEPGGYTPDELLEDLAPTLPDPVAHIVGVHIYTFNQVETTERWRRAYLQELEQG